MNVEARATYASLYARGTPGQVTNGRMLRLSGRVTLDQRETRWPRRSRRERVWGRGGERRSDFITHRSVVYATTRLLPPVSGSACQRSSSGATALSRIYHRRCAF